jgi:hypothetical protein
MCYRPAGNHRAFAGLATVATLAVCLFCSSSATADPATYAAAVNFCRSHPKQFVLNESQSIFCFDGKVEDDRDVSALGKLNKGGLFVVRSQGGSVIAAMKIATILEGKEVTAVVYDYCFSACAHFFSVAATRTYVLRDTLVTWHYGSADWWLACDPVDANQLVDLTRRPKAFCSDLSPPTRQRIDELRAIAEPFFKRRILIESQLNLATPPQSPYIIAILRSKYRTTGSFPADAWTLNPRYSKMIFRTELIYEAYPESQDEVDALITRFYGARRARSFILHDP